MFREHKLLPARGRRGAPGLWTRRRLEFLTFVLHRGGVFNRDTVQAYFGASRQYAGRLIAKLRTNGWIEPAIPEVYCRQTLLPYVYRLTPACMRLAPDSHTRPDRKTPGLAKTVRDLTSTNFLAEPFALGPKEPRSPNPFREAFRLVNRHDRKQHLMTTFGFQERQLPKYFESGRRFLISIQEEILVHPGSGLHFVFFVPTARTTLLKQWRGAEFKGKGRLGFLTRWHDCLAHPRLRILALATGQEEAAFFSDLEAAVQTSPTHLLEVCEACQPKPEPQTSGARTKSFNRFILSSYPDHDGAPSLEQPGSETATRAPNKIYWLPYKANGDPYRVMLEGL